MRLLTPLALALILAGCAAPSVQDAGPQPASEAAPDAQGTAAAGGTAADVKPPRVLNGTPFPHVTLTGVDQFGEYFSMGLKISYDIDAQGRLEPAERAEHEPMIDGDTPTADEHKCTDAGGPFNQLTTWFPDTGIFVAGATLRSLRSAQGETRPLLSIAKTDHGLMAVAGKDARAIEYAYSPCVGSKRVAAGHRTVAFVEPGDKLGIVPSGSGARGRTVTLTMPEHPRPYVVLDFARGGMRAIAPARLVVLAIDWPRRRAVAQYQVTAALSPRVASAFWSATLPPDLAGEHISASKAAFNQAAISYLKSCPAPRKPMDPCANPHGPLPDALQRPLP
ncbi:hypothetical protein [Ottowia sp.]|uniref:hypothetical protein n=1 Tax=Ottowia sp. TaxID=1898956 RepID=UPI003C70E158